MIILHIYIHSYICYILCLHTYWKTVLQWLHHLFCRRLSSGLDFITINLASLTAANIIKPNSWILRPCKNAKIQNKEGFQTKVSIQVAQTCLSTCKKWYDSSRFEVILGVLWLCFLLSVTWFSYIWMMSVWELQWDWHLHVMNQTKHDVNHSFRFLLPYSHVFPFDSQKRQKQNKEPFTFCNLRMFSVLRTVEKKNHISLHILSLTAHCKI